MTLRLKSARAFFILTFTEGIGFASSLIRNIILARLLTKADFGISATMGLIINLLEFSAKMGVARCLIRDKHGNDPEFVASAHVVQFSVGLISAVIMAAAAWPLAHLFDIPDHVMAVMSLALIPIFRGAEHMDVRRYERELGYGPSSITEVFPLVVVTLAAWPVAKWFGDYRAVLVLLLTKALLGCATSHLLAERPYSWRGHIEHIRSVMRFGWPLVVNGFMMFGIFQGEQFLVATFYPMSELASYAAAMTLGTAPAYVLGRVFHPIVLPVLAKAQDDPGLFRQRYRVVVSAIALFASASGVAMMVGAEALMRLLYGQKYTSAGIVLACLAAAGSVRLVRTATSVAALAKGDSQNEMWSNGARMLGLLPALGLVMQHQPIWLVACTGLIGEALACGVAVVRLRRRDKIPNSATLVPLTLVVAWIGVGAAVFLAVGSSWPIAWSLMLAVGLAAASSVTALSLPELRREIVTSWRDRRNPGRSAESPISVSSK